MNGRRALWLIALAALALRLVLLVARGDYVVYDEGYYLLLARSLRAGHGFTLNGLPHVALSPLQPVLVALLSAVGLPDLWASRLLAAVCGSLLVFPVASLGRRAGGPQAGVAAAVFTAASPALMSFVPFFPGESWNLYFGSEPLFLLLAVGAVAAAARAEEGGWPWALGSGLLAGAAYLARAEGAVLAPVLLVVLAIVLVFRRKAAAWPRIALAVVAAAVVAAPYLLYLHATLGRWAVSGRVQAASEAGE
ncbi:MAG TPA: glycosyltransferase family 39 protein, partial [Gemmatimonadales bacterium]|nr:glycosyltransferase family 39 protein [Gemmatimonadales bacterium]